MRIMVMNPIKLVTPDFLPGKIIFFLRALFDAGYLMVRRPSRLTWRLAGLFLRIIPRYTMVMPSRLLALYDLVRAANEAQLAGDIVQCGVWNGGSAAIMGIACQDGNNSTRRLWLFDSFEGVPRPSARDGKIEQQYFFEGWNKGEVEQVKQVFGKLNVSLDQARIVPGWFDATLPQAPVEQIALLHIDADWYDSVKEVLKNFYGKVVPGGFIVFDDYGTWSGCRAAVTDFFQENRIANVELKRIDRSGIYFQKPKS